VSPRERALALIVLGTRASRRMSARAKGSPCAHSSRCSARLLQICGGGGGGEKKNLRARPAGSELACMLQRATLPCPPAAARFPPPAPSSPNQGRLSGSAAENDSSGSRFEMLRNVLVSEWPLERWQGDSQQTVVHNLSHGKSPSILKFLLEPASRF
jgi:hypothetical protein